MKTVLTIEVPFALDDGTYRSPFCRQPYTAPTHINQSVGFACFQATVIWRKTVRERVLSDISLRPALMGIVAEHGLDLSGFPQWKQPRDREITGSDEEVVAFYSCLQILKDRVVQKKPPARSPSSSYNLKHRAEEWARPHFGGCYVGNGIMIAAIIHLGIPFEYSNCDAIPALRREKRRRL